MQSTDFFYAFLVTTSASLSFSFIGNACGIFTGSRNTRILCDPWLVDGVFDGSWCHYPPLKTRFEDVADVDAVFVSHLHPDHFDVRHFDFDRQKPILILNHGPNFLRKQLKELGFINIVEFEDGVSAPFNEFMITLFAPFARNNFHEAEVGNLIDSAMLVECDGVSALNANDNTPTPETCAELRDRFGTIDLAMINYNAAGPYPSCFNNLNSDEKNSEHQRILDRNFAYLHELVEMLKPKYVLPFAGSYVLGGKLSELNEYLGTSTWDVCAQELNFRGLTSTQTILLRENDVFDIGTGESNCPYVPIDEIEMALYANQISSMSYPYQSDASPILAVLLDDIETASRGMHDRMRRYSISSKTLVYLELDGHLCQILPVFKRLVCTATSDTPSLTCSLDPRLMRRILDRISHWNNAEIGCHIQFVRIPNSYEPDLHTALQFLHL